MVKVAVVGSGYWGKNLVRNFHALGALVAICDKDPRVLATLSEKYGEAQNTYQECLVVSQKFGRKDTIGRARLGFAKISEKQGNFKEALNQVKEAYNLFEKLGMKKYIDESQEMIDRLEKKMKK